MDQKLLYLCFLFLAVGYCQEPISTTMMIINAVSFISGICTIGSTIDMYAIEHGSVSTESNLQWLKNSIADIADNLKYVKENLVKDFMKEGNIEKVTNLDNQINEIFKHIHKHYNVTSKNTLEDKIKQQLYGDGIVKYIRDVRGILTGPNSLIKKLHDEKEKKCTGVSEQRWFYNLLSKYLLTEMRALAVANITYLAKVQVDMMKNEIPSYEEDIGGYIKETKEKVSEATKLFREVIAGSSRLHQSCDLQTNHKKGKSYTYFSRLFQWVLYTPNDILGTVGILGGWKWGSDGVQKCPDKYDVNRKPVCTWEYNCQLNVRKCLSVIRCNYIGEVSVCSRTDPDSESRYVYAVAKGNQASGSCMNNGDLKTIEFACQCICDDLDDPQVERLISLADVQSDIANNRIVTGIRLVKKKKKLFFKIKETELLPNKTLNLTDSDDGYDNDDDDDDDKWISKIYFEDEDTNKGENKMKYIHGGGIYFDKLSIPADAFLTGIRFEEDYAREDVGVKLAIRITRLKPGTYKLDKKSSEWLRVENHSDRKKAREDGYYNAPINTDKEHKVLEPLLEGTFLFLEPSDLGSSDAGQTAGPYIDIQKIDTKDFICSVALAFAGAKGSMGYIKVVVEICDLTPLVKIL